MATWEEHIKNLGGACVVCNVCGGNYAWKCACAKAAWEAKQQRTARTTWEEYVESRRGSLNSCGGCNVCGGSYAWKCACAKGTWEAEQRERQRTYTPMPPYSNNESFEERIANRAHRYSQIQQHQPQTLPRHRAEEQRKKGMTHTPMPKVKTMPYRYTSPVPHLPWQSPEERAERHRQRPRVVDSPIAPAPKRLYRCYNCGVTVPDIMDKHVDDTVVQVCSDCNQLDW